MIKFPCRILPRLAGALFVVLASLTPAVSRAADPAPATPAGATLPEATRGLLARYETARAALAADSFPAAQAAAASLAADAARPETPAPAGELAAPADAVAKSKDLKAAREAFKSLSVVAIRLTEGAPGFVVINCPMTPKGDWLQTDAKISNPYYGRTMLTCGVVKKRS